MRIIRHYFCYGAVIETSYTYFLLQIILKILGRLKKEYVHLQYKKLWYEFLIFVWLFLTATNYHLKQNTFFFVWHFRKFDSFHFLIHVLIFSFDYFSFFCFLDSCLQISLTTLQLWLVVIVIPSRAYSFPYYTTFYILSKNIPIYLLLDLR